ASAALPCAMNSRRRNDVIPRHSNVAPSAVRNRVPETLRCASAVWRKPHASSATISSASALRKLDAVEPKERSCERRRGTFGAEAALAEAPLAVLVDVRRDAVAFDALDRIERARAGTRQASTRLRGLRDHARREGARRMDRRIRPRRGDLNARAAQRRRQDQE